MTIHTKALIAACGLLTMTIVSGCETALHIRSMGLPQYYAWNLVWLSTGVGSILILKRWAPERRTVLRVYASFFIVHTASITTAYLLAARQ